MGKRCNRVLLDKEKKEGTSIEREMEREEPKK